MTQTQAEFKDSGRLVFRCRNCHACVDELQYKNAFAALCAQIDFEKGDPPRDTAGRNIHTCAPGVLGVLDVIACRYDKKEGAENEANNKSG